MDYKDYRHTIREWALIFRNELVDIPPEIEINDDFLKDLTREDFEQAYRSLWYLFYQIYTDAAKDTLIFRVSDEESDKRIQRGPAGNIFCHMKQLYLLFKAGILTDDGLNINTNNIKQSHKKSINSIIPVLTNYGFDFEGLIDGKITSKVLNFYIYYPDAPTFITVLYLVAKQAYMVKPYIYCNNEFGDNINLFMTWNYRLLAGAFGEYKYNDTYILFRDSLHKDEQKQFIDAFHEAMLSHGYFTEHWPGRGGGHISYFYKSIKEPYYFDVCTYHEFGMDVKLRIRNPEKCFEYMNNCPAKIKDTFKTSVYGCGNHNDCNIPHKYIYEGVEVNKCACCGPGHEFEARIEDIPHYIKLVELSVKK